MDLTAGISAGVGILGLLWTIGLALSQQRSIRKRARRLREAHEKLQPLLRFAQKPRNSATLQSLVSEVELLRKEYPESREVADAAASLSQELRRPELEAALSQVFRELLHAPIKQQLEQLVPKLARLRAEYGDCPELQQLQRHLKAAIQQHETLTPLHTGVGGLAEGITPLAETLFDPDVSPGTRASAGAMLVLLLVILGLFLSIFVHC